MLNFATYEDAKSVFGKEIETPLGVLKVTGVGMAGDKFNASKGI